MLDHEEYIKLINNKYSEWEQEGKEIQDPRVLWDFIKYKIRQETISYSKRKARERRANLHDLEKRLKSCQSLCDSHPSDENLNELDFLQTEYDRHYEYITKGTLIRSWANWYEYGEKSNKYFLNLENSRKKKCVRKLHTDYDSCTSDPRKIMNEFKIFYEDLYNGGACKTDHLSTDLFLQKINTKKLTNEQRDALDKELTISECFSILKTFQKNKTPGNDGLTVEFYLEFWPILAKPLVNCLNFAHYYGELSNSQKQALITLLEKKDKDRRFIKNWRPISLINVDVKIASKVIAKRLEPLLPDLIHHNQNAFIRGRSIFDAVRTIDDVLEYAKITNKSGILVTIDFEKAFSLTL